MIVEFGYGISAQTVDIPDCNLLTVLNANPIEHKLSGKDAVLFALEHPIDGLYLHEIVNPGQKVVIIASDISRPIPSWQVVPLVLKELLKLGCMPKDIKVVFALGAHRNHTEAEKIRLVGEYVYNTVSCVDSDPDDCVCMGVTSNGTPVDVTRTVAEADIRICTGNIEFHYFAGYSGGAKAIMPGVSSHNAIECNHRMMIDSQACAGNLDTNPIRQDIEEVSTFCKVHYIVNVVLDEHKQIVYAVAGDAIKAHREGCRYLNTMYRKTIPQKADIVIVSQGGAPKDANLYQTQKALDNAKHAVKKGGRIILIGACNEGMGSTKFAQWFCEAKSPHELIERVYRRFELGGHKAAAMAMVLENASIDLISEMPDDYVKSLFMTPRNSAQEALDLALTEYGSDCTVIAIPYGGAILPFSDE